VAATPNGKTKVIAARGWSKLTRMKGQATPNIESGRAMAKKASRARMKNMLVGHFQGTARKVEGVAALMLR
jgi:hypothetical protein